MTISDICIRRPVLATVVNLLIIVIGAVAATQLPIRELPDIDAATVTVATGYVGAAPEVIDTQITEVVEAAVAGVAGIDSIDSSSRQGSSRVKISFSQGRNIDEAANDVRSAVARVTGRLPEEAEEPRVFKNDSDADPIMRIAIVSTRLSAAEITDYAERFIIDRLATLDGVASVELSGARRYAMRISLDPKGARGAAADCDGRGDGAARQQCGTAGRAGGIDLSAVPVARGHARFHPGGVCQPCPDGCRRRASARGRRGDGWDRRGG